MTTQVLAVDVGNSRVKFGLLEPAADPQSLPRCVRATAAPHEGSACRDVLRSFLCGPAPPFGAVAGVNPRAVKIVLEAWPRDRWPEPLVLHGPAVLPIAICVDEPERVGIDRVLNAVAANVVRPPGQPTVIVDCGTATTVDAISAEGAFEGGAILPGVELAAVSLHEHTARLPLVPVGELIQPSQDPIGRNTREAIQSGVLWGQVGAVRELIQRLSVALADRARHSGDLGEPSAVPSGQSDARRTLGSALGSVVEPVVFLTGGGAPLLAPYFPQARLEPHLALQGLAAVAFGSVRDGGES